MSGLFGNLVAEAPITQGLLEGSIKFHEGGFVYEGPGINGKVYSYYNYIEKLDRLEDRSLGQVGVRMAFFSTMGERFDVKFAINEHYFHELNERRTRGV